jgi:hypothetical protein
LLLLAFLSTAGSGCRKEEAKSAPDKALAIEMLASLTESQEAQKEIAIASRDKLFAALVAELTASLAENGAAKSIKVCKSSAPELAKLVSMEPGLKIGRTSFKLRNPENQPPDWAQSFVKDRVDKEVYVELPDQTLGALLPIHLKTTCILCHGNDEQVMPEVKAAIVSNYPDDQATGFSEGDLRGYFWAEVTSRRQE